ncbi:MAG: hypothetical protein PHX61_08995 [Alphaproteobacteria bacterium]|nr:hypothetical protein [Alphaproteobacteria bacterium]
MKIHPPPRIHTPKRILSLIGLCLYFPISILVAIDILFLIKEISPVYYFIWPIVLIVPNIVLYKIYTGTAKAQDEAFEKHTTLEKAKAKEILENTIASREDEFMSFVREINRVLHERYNVKEELTAEKVDIAMMPLAKHFEPIATTEHQKESFLSNKSAHLCAQEIYEKIKKYGYDGTPEIFNEEYVRKTLPKFFKFNKLIFGCYNPQPQHSLQIVGIFACLALALYGIPQFFTGTNAHPFISSATWKESIDILLMIITVCLCYIALNSKNKAFYKHLEKTSGRFGKFLMLPLMPLLLYFILSITFEHGTGKFLNSIFGKEETVMLKVLKDKDTRKGRHNSITAYCLKIKSPQASFMDDEYCIRKSHYDLMLENITYEIPFKGKKSFFGFTIEGYHFPDVDNMKASTEIIRKLFLNKRENHTPSPNN